MCVEIIHGGVEEALDLCRVQVHRHDAVCTSGFDSVGTNAPTGRNSRFVFLVSFALYCAWPETTLLAKCEDGACQGAIVEKKRNFN